MNSTPFRVIGFGKEGEAAVNEIIAKNLDYTKAEVAGMNDTVVPHEGDKMAILLAGNSCKGFVDTARAFRKAGLLTLAAVTDVTGISPDLADSLTTVPAEKLAEVTEIILYPFSHSGAIHIGFFDLDSSMKATKNFVTSRAVAEGDERIKKAIESTVCNIGHDNIESADHIIILLSHNPGSSNPIKMGEIIAITDFTASLPDTVDLIWGNYFDHSMPDDAVGVMMIASGNMTDVTAPLQVSRRE
ncbi:MAG: hypothetical protein HDR90_03145 [Bacteroides sp.]|nr:hypothetical protein [Bacteroides sp.]